MTLVPGKPNGRVSTPPPMADEEPTTRLRALTAPPGPRFTSAPELITTGEEDATLEEAGPISGRRMAYAPGLIVADKYELLRPLGAGGMGEVWVAHHLSLDIDVAVKFIGDVGAPESGLSERLLEEARNTARLGHPAIVRALDFGHTDRHDPFIVLELLAGEDLATHIEHGGRLSAERAVATLLPVVHALSAVHDSGIVHRDIKPENVFLAETELGLQAKLLDFGISRKTDRVRRLTVRETALGTPDYMSPEQARGETSDAHTDQWSFCVVLYEAITNRRPFEAENYNALLRSIIEDAPGPLAEHGVQEPALWQILSRGLAKAPAERYASIRHLGQALALWLLDRGVQEDAIGTSLRRAWLREASSGVVSHPDLTEAMQRVEAQQLAEAVQLVVEPAQQSVPVVEPALKPRSSPLHSVPDLAALAELHRGGDPEDCLRRDAQRRAIIAAALITTLICGIALSILVGTGVIVF
ncbi:MAG: serine/threonine-protein kinase [Pseudomonadota bacterium]